MNYFLSAPTSYLVVPGSTRRNSVHLLFLLSRFVAGKIRVIGIAYTRYINPVFIFIRLHTIGDDGPIHAIKKILNKLYYYKLYICIFRLIYMAEKDPLNPFLPQFEGLSAKIELGASTQFELGAHWFSKKIYLPGRFC